MFFWELWLPPNRFGDCNERSGDEVYFTLKPSASSDVFALWVGWNQLVMEVLLPLAEQDVMHTQIRWDCTANIMYNNVHKMYHLWFKDYNSFFASINDSSILICNPKSFYVCYEIVEAHNRIDLFVVASVLCACMVLTERVCVKNSAFKALSLYPLCVRKTHTGDRINYWGWIVFGLVG